MRQNGFGARFSAAAAAVTVRTFCTATCCAGERCTKCRLPLTADFFINGSINHQSSFIRAALFREQGGYNENYRVLSDVEKWIVWIKAGRVFRHLPVVVADFDAGGVSSSGSRLTKAEKAKIIARYYTTEELAANRAGQKVCWTVKLFGFLVLLKIRKEPFQDTFRVNLFGFVPLLKIRKNTK